MKQHWFNVIPANELMENESHVCTIDNKTIAVFNLANQFYAIEDFCPHQGLPLSDGLVERDQITCPFHGARFCIKSGQVLSPPACVNLNTFETRIEDGILQVRID